MAHRQEIAASSTGGQWTHCWAQRFQHLAARAHSVLCFWALCALCCSPTCSHLLSHSFLKLFLICNEMLLQERTRSNAVLYSLFLKALFPFLCPSPFSLSPFPHYCGKGRKAKKTLQKWKISLLYHKDELCNHFPLSKELKDNKSPN